MKKLTNGNVAILLLNQSAESKTDVVLNLSEIGITGKAKVRDVMNHKDLGTYKKPDHGQMQICFLSDVFQLTEGLMDQSEIPILPGLNIILSCR